MEKRLGQVRARGAQGNDDRFGRCRRAIHAMGHEMLDGFSVSRPASSVDGVLESPSDGWESVTREVPDWGSRSARREGDGKHGEDGIGDSGGGVGV